MGDKGRKDKNKHNKQVNKAKNTKNEAKKKKQEKTHQQKKGWLCESFGGGSRNNFRHTIRDLLPVSLSLPNIASCETRPIGGVTSF